MPLHKVILEVGFLAFHQQRLETHGGDLSAPLFENLRTYVRIPRHSDTQPTLIRTPVPRSFGQAVGAQRRRGGHC